MATDGEAYIDAAQQPLDAASADTTVDNSLSTAVPQTVEFLVSNVAVVSKKKKKRGVGHKGGLRKLTKGDKKELKGMVADYIERGTFEVGGPPNKPTNALPLCMTLLTLALSPSR